MSDREAASPVLELDLFRFDVDRMLVAGFAKFLEPERRDALPAGASSLVISRTTH